MIDLVFKSVDIRDFKAFKSWPHTLYLDRDPGLYFVQGKNLREPALSPNGSAKSTLWDAITWCLYGQTIEGLKNPDIIPWKVREPKTMVRVTVWVGKTLHKIRRTATPNRLTLNGKDTSPDAIVKLLRMPYEVFTNTVILGQDQDLFLDRSPSDKLKLLSDVKNLDAWDERSKRASTKSREIELEMAQLEGHISTNITLIADFRKMLALIEPKATAWRKQSDLKLAQDASWVKANKVRLETLQRKADGLNLKYDGAMTEVKACERAIAQLQTSISTEQNNKFTLTLRRENLVEDIERCEKEYEKCKPGQSCPTCGRPLKQDGGISHHRAELKRTIAYAEKQLTEIKIKPIRLVIDQLQKTLKRAQASLADFHVKADVAIQAQELIQGDLADLKAKFAAIRNRKLEAGQTENPYTEQLRQLRTQIKFHESDLHDMKSDKKLWGQQLERTRYWVKGFKDVKLHIIEELLGELELMSSSILEEVGLIGWELKYSIERETKKGNVSRGLTVMIKSPASSGLVKWESWSGGERQRLRLIGSLALSQVLLNHAGITVNFEVLDEPTRSLSDGGIHDLIETLAERAVSTDRTIFYTDHQSVESARFAGTVLVVRDRAGARLARGGGR